MGKRCKKAFDGVRDHFRDLAEESSQSPNTQPLQKPSSSSLNDDDAQVTEADALDNLEPPESVLNSQNPEALESVNEGDGSDLSGSPAVYPQVDQLVGYARKLDEKVQGLNLLMTAIEQSRQVEQGQIDRLNELASSHAKSVTSDLPSQFGLSPNVVSDWLQQSHDPNTIAANLKQFLAQQLQAKGHDSKAADWLFQQILAAGSTCMTSLALRDGNLGRCKAYGRTTIDELGRHASLCGTEDQAAALIQGWNQGARTSHQQTTENDQLLALKHVMQFAGRQTRLKPHPVRLDWSRVTTAALTKLAEWDFEGSAKDWGELNQVAFVFDLKRAFGITPEVFGSSAWGTSQFDQARFLIERAKAELDKRRDIRVEQEELETSSDTSETTNAVEQFLEATAVDKRHDGPVRSRQPLMRTAVQKADDAGEVRQRVELRSKRLQPTDSAATQLQAEHSTGQNSDTLTSEEMKELQVNEAHDEAGKKIEAIQEDLVTELGKSDQ